MSHKYTNCSIIGSIFCEVVLRNKYWLIRVIFNIDYTLCYSVLFKNISCYNYVIIAFDNWNERSHLNIIFILDKSLIILLTTHLIIIINVLPNFATVVLKLVELESILIYFYWPIEILKTKNLSIYPITNICVNQANHISSSSRRWFECPKIFKNVLSKS